MTAQPAPRPTPPPPDPALAAEYAALARDLVQAMLRLPPAPEAQP